MIREIFSFLNTRELFLLSRVIPRKYIPIKHEYGFFKISSPPQIMMMNNDYGILGADHRNFPYISLEDGTMIIFYFDLFHSDFCYKNLMVHKSPEENIQINQNSILRVNYDNNLVIYGSNNVFEYESKVETPENIIYTTIHGNVITVQRNMIQSYCSYSFGWGFACWRKHIKHKHGIYYIGSNNPIVYNFKIFRKSKIFPNETREGLFEINGKIIKMDTRPIDPNLCRKYF